MLLPTSYYARIVWPVLLIILLLFGVIAKREHALLLPCLFYVLGIGTGWLLRKVTTFKPAAPIIENARFTNGRAETERGGGWPPMPKPPPLPPAPLPRECPGEPFRKV